MLFVAGIVLLALGIISGLFLLLFPLGLTSGAPGITLWVLFPLFTILGYLMAAAPARDSMVPMLSRASGALLLLLALGSGVVLVMQAGGVLQPQNDTTSLWYVLVVGIVLGAAGVATRGEGGKPAA